MKLNSILFLLLSLLGQSFLSPVCGTEREDCSDYLVKVNSVTASSFQQGTPPGFMIDGDWADAYHSKWDNRTDPDTYFPITLVFNFSDADRIDYLVYYPRQDGGSNGFFKEIELYAKCMGDQDYFSLGIYDLEGRSSATVINLEKELIRPVSIKMQVLSGEGDGQGFASCAEMQFFKSRIYPEIDKVFKDRLCTEVKKKVSNRMISRLPFPELQKLARDIRAGNYETDYRVAEYRAFFNPAEFEKRMRLRKGYTRNQNVTGILIRPGRQFIMVDGITGSKSIWLNVVKWHDLERKGQAGSRYLLHNGLNIINHNEAWSGLAYLDYSGKTPEKLSPVKVHFIGAAVNGYFDAYRQDNKAWDNCLEHAVYPIMDAVGKYVQLAYPVADFKRYAGSAGVELVKAYDREIEAQYDLMGYTKYGHNIYGNRIQARAFYIGNSYVIRDSEGIGFNYKAMDFATSSERITSGDTWALSYGLGHVHQLFPYFQWGGITRISNNICSMYMQTQVSGRPSRLLKEGRYAAARRNFFEDGLAGTVSKMRAASGKADSIITRGSRINYLEVDVFQGLIPFWKLFLYFKEKGYTDFYPDLYEALRQTPDEKNPTWLFDRSWADVQRVQYSSPSSYQLNFVKKASLVAKVNLYPFFEQYGFFSGFLVYNDNARYLFWVPAAQLAYFKEDLYGLGLPDLTPEELEKLLAIEDEK